MDRISNGLNIQQNADIESDIRPNAGHFTKYPTEYLDNIFGISGCPKKKLNYGFLTVKRSNMGECSTFFILAKQFFFAFTFYFHAPYFFPSAASLHLHLNEKCA